jgi:NADP-dependent 3-hydroxy acid dehydrogenase YdfG
MTADPGKTGGHQAPRTVLLTGTSAGIGLEIAQQLVTHGFEVWGTSRDPQRLPKLPHFHPVQMDLSHLESIHNGFAQASNEAGAGCHARCDGA